MVKVWVQVEACGVDGWTDHTHAHAHIILRIINEWDGEKGEKKINFTLQDRGWGKHRVIKNCAIWEGAREDCGCVGEGNGVEGKGV